MAHDVFISHSSKDKTIADATCAYLEARKIRCWVAPRDIRPGASWGASIVKAIRSARVVVLILSKSANASPQIKREVERAVHFGCAIIPMRIENVLPEDDLEYFLGTPHWLDAFAAPLERHLEALANAVHEFLEIPAPPLPVPESEPEPVQEYPSGAEVFTEPDPIFMPSAEADPELKEIAPPAPGRDAVSRRPPPDLPPRTMPIPPPIPARVSPTSALPDPPSAPPPLPKTRPSLCPPPLPIHVVRSGPPPLLKKVPPPVLTYYEAAANRGEVEAQYHLGKSYSSGHGVPQNYATALAWYGKAAEQGYVLAQMDLAYMHETGVGVERDLAQARRWYEKAAAQGNGDAQAKLHELV